MTPERIAELRAARKKATAGEWHPNCVGDEWSLYTKSNCDFDSQNILLADDVDEPPAGVPDEQAEANAAFIALAANHWNELLDEIERLEKELLRQET